MKSNQTHSEHLFSLHNLTLHTTMACKIDKIAILSDSVIDSDLQSNQSKLNNQTDLVYFFLLCILMNVFESFCHFLLIALLSKSEYLNKDWQVVTLCSGKLIAIARDCELTIWKQANGNNSNELIDLKIVHQQKFTDPITKLVGCPFFLQTASYNASPDIHCFLLGFTSGL